MIHHSQNNRLSVRFASIAQKAVDNAIEQHRLNGYAISVSDDLGNVIEIQPEDIIPLADKLQKRQLPEVTTS